MSSLNDNNHQDDDIDDLEKLFNDICIDESTVVATYLENDGNGGGGRLRGGGSADLVAATVSRLVAMVSGLREWSVKCRLCNALKDNNTAYLEQLGGNDAVARDQILSDLNNSAAANNNNNNSFNPPLSNDALIQRLLIIYNENLVSAMSELRQYLTETPPPIDAVLDTGIWTLVAYYLEHPYPLLSWPMNSPRLMYEASWVILNLFSGNENQVYKVASNTTIIQSLLKIAGFCRLAVDTQNGSTHGLGPMAVPPNTPGGTPPPGRSTSAGEFVSLFTREHIIWALGNVAGTNHVFRMTLLARGFGPKLIKELHGVWETIRAAHCFSNGYRFSPPLSLGQPVNFFNYFASHPCAVDEEFREGVVKFPIFDPNDTSIKAPMYGPPEVPRPLAYKEVGSIRSMIFPNSHGRLPEDNVIEIVENDEGIEEEARYVVALALQDYKSGTCHRLDSIVGNFVWTLTNLVRPLDSTDSAILVNATAEPGEGPEVSALLARKVMNGLRTSGPHPGAPARVYPPIEDLAQYLAVFHPLAFLNAPDAYGETLWGLCFALAGFKLRIDSELQSLGAGTARGGNRGGVGCNLQAVEQCQNAFLEAMSPFLTSVVDIVCVISQRLLTYRWACKRRTLLHYFCPGAKRMLSATAHLSEEEAAHDQTAVLLNWDTFGAIRRELEAQSRNSPMTCDVNNSQPRSHTSNNHNSVPAPTAANPLYQHYLTHPTWRHPFLCWSVLDSPLSSSPSAYLHENDPMLTTPTHVKTNMILEDVIYYRTDPINNQAPEVLREGSDNHQIATPLEIAANASSTSMDPNDIHQLMDAIIFQLTSVFQIASESENSSTCGGGGRNTGGSGGGMEDIGLANNNNTMHFMKHAQDMTRTVWCGVLSESYTCASRRFSLAQQRRAQWTEHYRLYMECRGNPQMMEQARQSNPDIDPNFNLFSVLPDELQQDVWKEEMPGNVLAVMALALTRVAFACRGSLETFNTRTVHVDPSTSGAILGPQQPRYRALYVLWCICSNPYTAIAVRQKWLTLTYRNMLESDSYDATTTPASQPTTLFTSLMFNGAFEFICTTGTSAPNCAALAMEASFVAATKASVLWNCRDLIQFLDVFATASFRKFPWNWMNENLASIDEAGCCYRSRSNHLHFISKLPQICRTVCLVAIGMCCEMQAWCQIVNPAKLEALKQYLQQHQLPKNSQPNISGGDTVFISSVTFPYVDVAVVPLPFDGEEFLSGLVSTAMMDRMPCDISRSGPNPSSSNVEPQPFNMGKMAAVVGGGECSLLSAGSVEPATFNTATVFQEGGDPTQNLGVLTFEDVRQLVSVMKKTGQYAQSVLGTLKQNIIDDPVTFFKSETPVEFHNSTDAEFQSRRAFEMAGPTIQVFDLFADIYAKTMGFVGQ